ncbi:hypothetical protein F442_23136 [Phytophthora nicotianae P10297]|uniref:Uncharacterized protein n=1 Tax=Phytophthora nicotianae P10297 TaxID=1317064 RepID=W2Y075_PHYNI|nr:hypothetical protein F442_23136 [Phytophthora nicotianae P10297]
MAVPPASAAADSPASAAPSPRWPTVRPVVLPSDALVAPLAGMTSPASSEPHTSDEEILASFLDWAPTVTSVPVLMLVLALVRRRCLCLVQSLLFRLPWSMLLLLLAQVLFLSVRLRLLLVPPRTPRDPSESLPPTVLQQLIYEVTIEGLCGDDVGGDVKDDDAGEYSVAAENVPLQERARLRRGDGTSNWHLFPLPKAPEIHPTTNHRNHYNPDAPWDYANSAGITCLLDVEEEPPHRCYLVQWKGRPLQMSWVWMELLDKDSTRYMMRKVDEWKASGSEETFMGWYDVRDSASEAGTCFMGTFRCALYHLDRPNLVTMEMWDEYEKTRPEAFAFGVSREDVTEFWKILQHQSVPLDYGTMLPNILHGSIGSVATLERFSEALVPGTYLESAGQDDIGHCFVVVKTGPNARLVVLDGYSADHDPPMEVVPLSNYQWIESVKWRSASTWVRVPPRQTHFEDGA